MDFPERGSGMGASLGGPQSGVAPAQGPGPVLTSPRPLPQAPGACPLPGQVQAVESLGRMAPRKTPWRPCQNTLTLHCPLTYKRTRSSLVGGPPPHSLLLAANRPPRLSQGVAQSPSPPPPALVGRTSRLGPARPGSAQPQAHPGGEVCSSQACARLRSRPSRVCSTGSATLPAPTPPCGPWAGVPSGASVGVGGGPRASCFLEESLGWPVVRLLPEPCKGRRWARALGTWPGLWWAADRAGPGSGGGGGSETQMAAAELRLHTRVPLGLACAGGRQEPPSCRAVSPQAW